MRPRRSSGERMLGLAGVLAVVIAACGGADETGPSTSSVTGTTLAVEEGTTVGPDGGTITSDDGMFTVEIPAGALSSELPLAITMVTPSDAGLDPVFLAGPIYDLLPDGTTFDAPVNTTRLLSADDLGIAEGAIPFFHVFQGLNDEWTPLSTETSREGDVILVRADTSHFSENVAVATTEVWGYGLEGKAELRPGTFTAPVLSTVHVDWAVDPPRALEIRNVDVEPSYTGAVAHFGADQGLTMVAECGTSPGPGTYGVRLDGRLELPWDYDESLEIGETGSDAFFRVFFGASPTGESFTISVVGEATCTEDESGSSSATGQDAASLLLGSFMGNVTFDSLTDESSYEAAYLLSVLSQESADSVLAEEGKQIAAAVKEILEQIPGDLIDGPTIVLSQMGANDVGQNTFGASTDLGDGTIRIFTASAEESYAEFYVIDLTFCTGFPVDCQDVKADALTVGGPPGLDLDQAFEEMLQHLEDQSSDAIRSGPYGWAYGGNGVLTREGG